MESPPGTVGYTTDRGSSGSSPDEGLTFSPDLGLSPVQSLSRQMVQLSCTDRLNPRRRLKMSPDSESPSPGDSASQAAAKETLTPAGFSVESPKRARTQTRTKSRRLSESSISKPKGFRLKLTNLFRSPESATQAQSEHHLCKKKPCSSEKRRDSRRRGSIMGPDRGVLLAVAGSIQQMPDTDIEDENLIGDFSKPYCLPVEAGKHQDLKYISCETVASLIIGKYNGVVEEYVMIDCRYPYEYAGGHIKGALNLYKEEDLTKTFFLQDPKRLLPVQRRLLLIFHCEFSSERGPKLCRTLRKLDRNGNSYPSLSYPELYVIKGGYKEFYETFQGLCEPQAYVHMLHTDFRDELRKFHRKHNPWTVRRTRKELFKPQNLNSK